MKVHIVVLFTTQLFKWGIVRGDGRAKRWLTPGMYISCITSPECSFHLSVPYLHRQFIPSIFVTVCFAGSGEACRYRSDMATHTKEPGVPVGVGGSQIGLDPSSHLHRFPLLPVSVMHLAGYFTGTPEAHDHLITCSSPGTMNKLLTSVIRHYEKVEWTVSSEQIKGYPATCCKI